MARTPRQRQRPAEPRTSDAPRREPEPAPDRHAAREGHDSSTNEEEDEGLEEAEHELLFDDDFSGLDDDTEEDDYD